MNTVRRWILIACGPMNMAGALAFAPPFHEGRVALGLPDAPPFYLWLLAIWVFAFGVAYVYQGLTGEADSGVLALGIVGKSSFAIMLINMAMAGSVRPIAIATAVPDMALAILFAWWIWKPTQ